jgi:hypothetical protein
MIERLSGDVCYLHRAWGDEERVFLGWASKPQGRRFVSGLASKSLGQVSGFGIKTRVDGFCRFDLKTDGFGFSGLWPKTGSFSLVSWSLKSLQPFLGLGLKTKWVVVCQLRYQTDGGMKTVRGMRRDLAACFMWK